MEDDSPLCCCEYYNLRDQRTHLLAFCCECDEVDKAVDDWLKGNPQKVEKITNIITAFSDRCRIPWVGGAQPFDAGIFLPPVILTFSAYLASMHFIVTIIVFLGFPVVVLCCYVLTIRAKMRTRFFLSLSLSSTAGCLAVYFYNVASFVPFLTNAFLTASALTVVICLHLLRRQSGGLSVVSQKTDCLSQSKVNNNSENSRCVTFCEQCNGCIPSRGRHCRICKDCIVKYDHHCVWINCCVGHHNHRIFLFTVSLYLVNIVVGCYVSFFFICDWSTKATPDCSHVYISDSSALVFVACCYAIVCGTALFVLLIQQLILITFNITSYEWRHMSHEQSCWHNLTSSPYNKGMLKNWTEFWFR